MGDALVRLDRISKSYGSDTHVLREVSIAFLPGQLISLTGPSGSGKSTLISLLAGLSVPDAGRVIFDGDDLAELDDVARARLRAQRIGIVLQSGNLIPFLTAAENVELATEFAYGNGNGHGQRASERLAELGVGDRAHHLPRRMSGGEAQRVAVAVALANDPELLLADEVTGQLDTANAEQVMATIFEAGRRRGLTVLFVTHNPELADRAERRLILDAGKVRER
jgi:putative ABC transport system ATP-binding protein